MCTCSILKFSWQLLTVALTFLNARGRDEGDGKWGWVGWFWTNKQLYDEGYNDSGHGDTDGDGKDGDEVDEGDEGEVTCMAGVGWVQLRDSGQTDN